MGTYALTGRAAALTAAVALAGSAAGPAVARPAIPAAAVSWSAPRGPIPQAATHATPGLTEITLPGSGLKHYLMAWKSSTSDSIYFSCTTGASPARWRPRRMIPAAKTTMRPSVAGYGDHVVAVWHGHTTASIWYSVGTTHRGGAITWTPQRSIPGIATSDGPTVFAARHSGTLILAYTGNTTGNIYYKLGTPAATGVAWGIQRQLPGGAQSVVTPAIAEVSTGSKTGRIYVFWRGALQTRPFFETTADPVPASPAWSGQVGFPSSIGSEYALSAAPAGRGGTFPLVVIYRSLSSSQLDFVTLGKSSAVSRQHVVPKATDRNPPVIFGGLLLEVQPSLRIDYSLLR